MRALAISVLLMLPISALQAAEIAPSPGHWTTSGSFSTLRDANVALSGAACVLGTRRCIAVNDENRFAQFFEIRDTVIVPGAVIALLPSRNASGKIKELDAEGAAYAPPRDSGQSGYFYITGSHGRSHSGEPKPTRYHVVRFPVDPSTGMVGFSLGSDEPAREVQASGQLAAAIATLPALAPSVNRELQQQGLNIEGLAVNGNGDQLLFGLRSPCINRQAFIVQVPIDALFGAAQPSATLAPLTLGDNTGIRDLTKVKGGFLILSGRSDDDRSPATPPCGDATARPAPAVWFWTGTPGVEAQPLGTLTGLNPKGAPETLQLLSEDASSYRVLVWLDNVADGEPTQFVIPKPH